MMNQNFELVNIPIELQAALAREHHSDTVLSITESGLILRAPLGYDSARRHDFVLTSCSVSEMGRNPFEFALANMCQS
jgi:hypothetical protein